MRREFPGQHLDKSLNGIKDALRTASGAEKRALEAAKSVLEQSERLLEKVKGGMNGWCSVCVLFESKVDDRSSEGTLCEESIRLINAADADAAKVIAGSLGVDLEHEYANPDGKTVRWVFKGIVELQELCASEIVSGTEVFSRMFKKGQLDR